MQHLRFRAELLRSVRRFFDEQQSLEVETPAIVRSPGVDAHVDAIPAGGAWLTTSPEYHMKRLLADGSGPIHQLGKAWRAGEQGQLHEPEFTLLEWYVPGLDDAGLMAQTEQLIRHVAGALLPSSPWSAAPFARLTFREAFVECAGLDPASASERAYGLLLRAAGCRPPRGSSRADLEDLVLSTVVQRELAARGPTFVTDWPVERAALARLRPGRDADGCVSAARFELFAGGLELCNGYHELGDPGEQAARIDAANEARRSLGKAPYPVDDEFLDALRRGLPDCSGNALGIDRLQMLLAESRDIGEVRAFRVTTHEALP